MTTGPAGPGGGKRKRKALIAMCVLYAIEGL